LQAADAENEDVCFDYGGSAWDDDVDGGGGGGGRKEKKKMKILLSQKMLGMRMTVVMRRGG